MSLARSHATSSGRGDDVGILLQLTSIGGKSAVDGMLGAGKRRGAFEEGSCRTYLLFIFLGAPTADRLKTLERQIR